MITGVSLSTATGAAATAGTHPITPSGGAASNYAITNVPGTLTVSQAALTVTADDKAKFYGATLPTLTATYTGFLYTDDPASLTTRPTLSTTADATSHVSGSPYSITASGAVDPNYSISDVAGSLTVTTAPLTITADSKSKVYSAALPTLTATYTGFVNGDTSASLTTLPTITTTATAGSAVGTYPITASGAVGTDYSIHYVAGTLIINPAITVNPTNLPVATANVAFSQQLTASGGSGSGYSFTATGLPDGLSLTALGLLSGTPTTAAGLPYMVNVTVTDGDGGMASQSYPLTVKAQANSGSIVSSLPQSFFGQDVTLTATFSSTAAGSAPMTGTVAFYDGNTYLGTKPLITASAAGLPGAGSPAAPLVVSGTSSLPTSSLGIGGHINTAVYSGDANYSAVSTQVPVSVQVVSAVTSVTLTAATTAQGTTLAASVVTTSPGNPPIVGTVSFYDGTTLLGTAPLSNGVASLSISSLSSGVHTFNAVYSGSGTVSTSGASLVISTAGPQVTSMKRYGFHLQPTYVLLSFNGPLDPTSAQNPENYQILGPNGHQIAVASAIYDPATDTVTLVPAERLNIHQSFLLTVNGAAPSGLMNPSKVAMEGAGPGQIGSNYVTTIRRRNLVGRARKLPTLGLVHAASPRPAGIHTSRLHAKAVLHTAAVDHLLETESLNFRGKHHAMR